MKFRTEIKIDSLPKSKTIDHKSKILMMGSCFSDNIGQILQKYLFNISVNPFGVTYNPMSILNCLNKLQEKKAYEENDLELFNELWFSYDHYTLYSDTDKQGALHKINSDFKIAKQTLQELDFLVLTFGTSWVYSKKKEGTIVNNCHKIPTKEFDRRSLSVDEIVESYSEFIERLKSIRPEAKIILTVSPVRHTKDGLIGNQQSKATLLLACGKLEELYPENCIYFPSYEIMMDDLRDYRFYASDMIHPNEQAIEYIWDNFSSSLLDLESRQTIQEIKPILNSLNHKPLHKDTEAYRTFKEQLNSKVKLAKQKFPDLCWDSL